MDVDDIGARGLVRDDARERGRVREAERPPGGKHPYVELRGAAGKVVLRDAARIAARRGGEIGRHDRRLDPEGRSASAEPTTANAGPPVGSRARESRAGRASRDHGLLRLLDRRLAPRGSGSPSAGSLNSIPANSQK